MNKIYSKEKIDLKEYIEALLVEKDKRYEQKFSDTKIAVDAALIAADKAVAAALAGQKEAVTKAEIAAEKRFESVNEFRSTLSDQQRTLIPRAEAELVFKGLDVRINVLEERKIEKSGEFSGAKNLWAVIVGIVGLIGIIFGFVSYFK